MGFEADEGVDGEEGESCGGAFPREEVDEALLEDEDDAYACIEAAEVVGHETRAEFWSVDGFLGASVLFARCVGGVIVVCEAFAGDDLGDDGRQQFVLETLPGLRASAVCLPCVLDLVRVSFKSVSFPISLFLF